MKKKKRNNKLSIDVSLLLAAVFCFIDLFAFLYSNITQKDI